MNRMFSQRTQQPTNPDSIRVAGMALQSTPQALGRDSTGCTIRPTLLTELWDLEISHPPHENSQQSHGGADSTSRTMTVLGRRAETNPMHMVGVADDLHAKNSANMSGGRDLPVRSLLQEHAPDSNTSSMDGLEKIFARNPDALHTLVEQTATNVRNLCEVVVHIRSIMSSKDRVGEGCSSHDVIELPSWAAALKADMQATIREELSQIYEQRIQPALTKDIQAALHGERSAMVAELIAASSAENQDISDEDCGHANVVESQGDQFQTDHADQGVVLAQGMKDTPRSSLSSLEADESGSQLPVGARDSSVAHGLSKMKESLAIHEAEEVRRHRCSKYVKRLLHVNLDLPDTCLTRLVESQAFYIIFQIIVFTNSMWLGFCAGKQIQDVKFQDEQAVILVDFCFALLFLVETTLRLAGLRWRYVFGEEWGWNCVDVILVVCSFPKLLRPMMDHTSTWFDHSAIFRIVRLARILRVFHVLKAIKELRLMVFILYQTIDTLFWVFVLFLLFSYCAAVVIMHSAAMYLRKIQGTTGSGTIADGVRADFGRVPDTMMVLFHIISGGDWDDSVQPLAKLWFGYKYVFATYMFFMMFGMINVVIGTFCEKAASAIDSDRILRTLREQECREDLIKAMRAMFRDMDTEQTGKINQAEFLAYIDQPFARDYLSSYGIKTHSPRELFSLIDYTSGGSNGHIDAASFVFTMERLVGGARGSDLETLSRHVKELQKAVKQSLTRSRKQNISVL